MRNKTIKQRGVSIIAALFIIVILAFMGVMFLTLFTTSTTSALSDMQSGQALYIAEGGIERVLRFLQEGGNCNNITATFSASTSLGDGSFTATGTSYRPIPQARLLNAILSTNTSIQSDTANLIAAGYAPSGRITIQDPPAAAEIIEYTSITNDTFNNCRRGVDGTTASGHSANRRIVLNQCDIVSSGTVTSGGFANISRQTRVSVWY